MNCSTIARLFLLFRTKLKGELPFSIAGTRTVITLRDKYPSFELEDGLLYFEGLIYVLVRVRELVM
jgi:hypothetical protein